MSHNLRTAERSAAAQATDTRLAELVRGRQLIVASNRQPYRHDADGEDGVAVDRPTGGLTAGLDPVMQRTGGTWVAWGDGDEDFAVADGDDCVSVPPDDPGYRLKRLRLSEDQVRDYYYGFSNQVLWPICHAALTRVRCDAGFWSRYCEVNERFAETVAARAGGRPLVWFHDYHLALAPRMARSFLPDDATVMHFWHIPWPSPDTFRACPHGRDLLDGMLGNDLIGVHAPRYRTNVLECVDDALDDATVDWGAGEVTYRGRTTTVEAIPMGVPVERIERSAAGSTAGSFGRKLAREYDIPAGTHVALGVDRLDYTKGIRERLRALERFWETYPGWRGELTYVQKSSESRSRIPAYREVQEDVAGAVERINGRFGTDDWQPVHHVTDRLPREDLYGLYRHADVALVSPIRDGMNLVAQEYVAAQGDGDGVLVLGEGAGFHDQVGEHAVSVTPSDTEGFAEAIARALAMSPGERRHRMHHLRRWVEEHDLGTWVEANLEAAMGAGRTDAGADWGLWDADGRRS